MADTPLLLISSEFMSSATIVSGTKNHHASLGANHQLGSIDPAIDKNQVSAKIFGEFRWMTF
jgi:hypothetical protein